ncbi:MAG: cobaltochelatase subunit CobN [Methanosaeta sp. PtaU1.Bin112]|nr:MAG: cobaltochelatase subunit CobN [Methanosaeta sp. PtaU1.Bin112]
MLVTFISTVSSSALAKAALELKEQFHLPLELKVYYPRQMDEEKVDDGIVAEDLRASDAVFLDIRGSGRSIDLVYQTLKDEHNIVVNLMAPAGKMMEITRLGSFSGRSLAGKIGRGEARDPEEVWKKISRAESLVQTAGRLIPLGPVRDAGNYVRLARYWRYGGKDNYRNLLILLLREYLKCELPQAKEPAAFPEYGIYHPELGFFQDRNEFLSASGYDPARPTVGILFYGNMHFEQCQPVLRSLQRTLDGINLLPVFCDGIHNLRAMRKFFFIEGRPMLDALVNLTWFRINGGPMGGDPELTRQLLSDLSAPVFTPACMYGRDIDEWRSSDTGLSPLESIMAVIWPELDGSIEPIPCCAVQNLDLGEWQSCEVAALEERVSKIASRIKSWISLKRKSNRDKRLAIIIYNYPPGEENLAVASYLDVFASVSRLLQRLKDEGYNVDLPKKPLHEIFQDLGLFNSAYWQQPERLLRSGFSLEGEEYLRFFSSLPQSMRCDVTQAWGEPPGKVMVADGRLLIPGVQLGSIFLGVQPARPPLGEEDVAKASHDKTRPPHHQYIGFYHWLEKIWKADAVVHVGTHGLAEFTKGKEIGLSNECFPDLLIGSLPHLYFYHVVNTSEVVIAKRRLYGTTIGYNSPPYMTSDLYRDYAELEDLIDEYGQARLHDPLRMRRIEEKILKMACELHLRSTDLDSIHAELYEMKRRIIPKGLHIIGERYQATDLKSFLEFILRYDREECRSLNRILAESRGHNFDDLLKDKSRYVSELEEIDRQASHLAGVCLDDSADAAVQASGLARVQADRLRKTLDYGLHFLEMYSANDGEVESFLQGLMMSFIPAASGGDVIRTPQILPTGRNLTQFDPTRVPTQTAVERGSEIAENTLSAYLKKEGRFPESTGVILWGFETTKTGGETIGQILSYLGVRLAKDAGAWAPRLDLVPLEELGRPRIDALVNICGFFRDMFPNVVLLLDRAFNLAAGQDEPLEMNFVRKHSLQNRERLNCMGLDEKTVRKMANGRIFGPKAGEYGTRMLPLVEDSIWRTEEELCEVFIQSMDHLYAENLHAVKNDAIYRSNLSRIDLVSQVRDSHDREIIDLDHYYEFFGGLSRAVQKERGEAAEMLISDTTGEIVQTEDVQDVIARGARTRLLNPKWADAMLEHDFHGAQQVADRVENMLGLAATTHSVESWIWSEIASLYIFDREMLEKLSQNNRYAAAEVTQRLLEAQRRGYWQATEVEKERMREASMEMEGKIEETT